MTQIRNSNFGDIVLWLLGQRQRFRVEGISMLPNLRSGEEVLVDCRAYRRFPPAVGDAIVFQFPDRPHLRAIKRAVAIRGDGACFVRGDNPSQSTDSRVFGWVEPILIIGRVTSRFF